MSALIIKHSKRIYETENHNYLASPWPKIYSFTKKNELNKNKSIIRNGSLLYYKPYPYTLCMYSQAPCSVYPANDINLRVIKKFNYLIYFKKKLDILRFKYNWIIFFFITIRLKINNSISFQILNA